MELNIDEQGYDVPNYMSVGDYAKIFKVKDLFTEQYFAAKLVSIITGAPLDKLMKADYEEVNYLAAYIMELIPTEKQKFVDRFELDGVHYGFIPNWRDLTFAEFVDLDTISTKPVTELLDMLHILAAIMYRPIEHEITEHNFLIEEYDIKKMTARAELFKKRLDVRYVLGAQTFFTSCVERFFLYSRASSIPKISVWKKLKILWGLRKIIWKKVFNKPTDGSLSSTDLLQMILQNTTKSTKKI
jgi:hypothetical protein